VEGSGEECYFLRGYLACKKFEKTQQGLGAVCRDEIVWKKKPPCLLTLRSTHFGVDLLMAALQMSAANPFPATKFSQT